MVLRGKVVEHHSIANDLKYPEVILYRPQTGGAKEVDLFSFHSSFIMCCMCALATRSKFPSVNVG